MLTAFLLFLFPLSGCSIEFPLIKCEHHFPAILEFGEAQAAHCLLFLKTVFSSGDTKSTILVLSENLIKFCY